MPDIASAYIAGEEAIAPFYPHSPASLLEDLPQDRPWDSRLVESMRTLQQALGLERSFQGNELVVVTGQQAGLFTGPLYTIYKAMTAIKVAERIRAHSGAPCVPIFWVGSEDHDFEEVRTVHYLDRRHQHRQLRYAPEYSSEGPLSGELNVSAFPMHHVPLTQPLHRFVDTLRAECVGSEFAEEIADFLHESLASCTSLADWCALLMARLFRDTDLLIFMPHMMAAREAAAPIIEQEIRHPLESTRLLNQAGEKLKEAGFQPLIVKGESECGFFLEMGSRRRKVLYKKDRFFLPEESMQFSQEELLHLLRVTPEQFSPNVALRCVTQQALFPAAAYVGGPGEVAYWAQLRPVFDFFQQPMPVLYPRARAVLSSTKLNKLKAKHGFSQKDFSLSRDELLQKALQFQVRNPALDILEKHRPELRRITQQLLSELGALELNNDAPYEMAQSLGDSLEDRLRRLERLLLREDSDKVEAITLQVDRLLESFLPDNKPQERVYSVFSFLFEQGWDLIPKLTDALDTTSFQLNEVEL